MKKILLLLFLSSMAFGFGSSTVKKIDEIENNTAADITINPTSDVIITSGIANRVPYFDASKKLKSSSVTDVELGFLSGATSGLQSQIDGKEPTINLTIDRAVISNGSGALSVATTTAAELDFVNGVTSSIQTQIDSKLTSPLTTNGDLYYYNLGNQRLPIGTLDQLLTVDASGIALWKDAPVSTTLSVKGDIQSFDTVNAALNVGTDGQLLSANSAIGIGLEWIDPPAVTPTTTQGDLILRGLTEDERLPIGTNLQLLTSDGTTASWQDAPVSTTLTTKGDIQTYDTANAALGVGADNEVLFADSSEATGLKWADPTTMVFSVAQAEIFGQLQWVNNVGCDWGVSKTTTFTNMPINANCLNPTVISGDISNDGDKSFHFIMPSGSPIGTYTVTVDAPTYNHFISANISCRFRLKSTNIESSTAELYTQGSYTMVPTASYSFKLDSPLATDEKVYLQARGNSAASGLCGIRNDLNEMKHKLTVKYFPPKETIVRQNQIEDASTANELSAVINMQGTPSIISTKHAWIDSVTDNGVGRLTLNFDNLILTQSMSCTVESWKAVGNDEVTCGLDNGLVTDSTQYSFFCSQNVSYVDISRISVHCSKQGPDVNKSLLVYGQFEQIQTTPVSIVSGVSDGLTHGLAANVTPVPWTETKDTNNEWNGTQFTANGDKTISFRGAIRTTALNGANYYMYVNGSPKGIISEVVSTQIQVQISGGIDLADGDVLEIRSNTSNTINSLPNLHWINFTETPDLNAIVKNLNDNNNVKCQTKYLSADFTGSSVDVPDLSFSNLIIGKRYSMKAHFHILENGSATTKEWYTQFRNGATPLANALTRMTGEAIIRESREINVNFTATATGTSFYQIYNLNTKTGGTSGISLAELCELPDNYIETTEF